MLVPMLVCLATANDFHQSGTSEIWFVFDRHESRQWVCNAPMTRGKTTTDSMTSQGV
jgi:hypothetical protein